MLVHPKPLGVSIAHRNHAVSKPAVRFAGTVRPSADTVHFGNSAFVVTPGLRQALNQFARAMDEAMNSHAVAELPEKVSVDRTRTTLVVRAPVSLIPGHENERNQITLTFEQSGRLWILNEAASSLNAGIDADTLAQSILSPQVLGRLRPLHPNSAAVARASADEAARLITVPLSRLVKQFPTQAGMLLSGKTQPVPVKGTADGAYLQLIFKRNNTIQMLVGPLGQTGIMGGQGVIPQIDFEFDGLGNINKSTLREEEERLLRAHADNIGRAAVDALVNEVAYDERLEPRIRDMMYHAAGSKTEVIDMPHGIKVYIQPAQVIIRKGNEWGMQWNAVVDPKQPYAPPDPSKPLMIRYYSGMALGDHEPERMTVERISRLLDAAYVRSMGGYFTEVTKLHSEFVGRARIDGKANPFFDPVDQMMAWNVGRNVIVYGDLDDILHNGGNLPGSLKAFVNAKGLQNTEAAKERYGEGIPFQDAIVLGWYNELLPGSGDVLLIVLDPNDPINSPPKMVALPKSTKGKQGFNRQNFNKVVTSDTMRAIAEAVRFPNEPVTRMVGEQEITTETPRAMMTMLADNVEGLLTEVPQFREVTRVLLDRLEAQYGVLKSTAYGTIAGIQDEIDALQAQLKKEYITKAREDRAKERATGKQAYEEARARAAAAMGTSGMSGPNVLQSLKGAISNALTVLKDEVVIQLNWHIWESRNTPAYHHKQEVNQRARAVDQGFRMNDRDVSGMVHALSDVNNKLQQIAEISARMNHAETEVDLLSISSPNLVASMAGNGKGYEPFSFDERTARIRELLEAQIRDYVTVTTLRNTVVNNLANITERIPKTGANIAAVVGRGQNRLTEGHRRVQEALTAGNGVRSGQLQLPGAVPRHIADKFIGASSYAALTPGSDQDGGGGGEDEFGDFTEADYEER